MKKIEVLIKPVSYDCNLNCGYCFYKKTAEIYTNKESLHMTEKVLEKLIFECMNYSDGGQCMFSWQGGEPLLSGIDFFKAVVRFQKKYGKSRQIVGNSIQTNGTMLNSKWLELFKEYNFFIGVSLDGPIEENNHYRHYSSGKGVFQETVNGIELLKSRNINFNILITIARIYHCISNWSHCFKKNTRDIYYKISFDRFDYYWHSSCLIQIDNELIIEFYREEKNRCVIFS